MTFFELSEMNAFIKTLQSARFSLQVGELSSQTIVSSGNRISCDLLRHGVENKSIQVA